MLNPVLAHNLLVQAELLRLARGLQARGVEFIVLKGVALLHRVYGRLDARPVLDNDLLFRERDVERALSVLGELGYRARRQAALEDALEADAKYGMVRWHHGQPLWLDVHFSPLVPTIHQAREDLFWRTRTTFELDQVSLPVLGEETTLLHLVAHAEQHAFCEPRVLRDVVAAYNAWCPADDPQIDAGRLLGLAGQLGLQHTLDYVLTAAWQLGLLSAPPPCIGSPRARLLLRVLPPERLCDDVPRGGAEAYRRTMASFLLRDPGKTWRQIRRDVLPPLSKLSVIHDQEPGPALYLRYLSRPFRPLGRLLGWHPPPPASD